MLGKRPIYRQGDIKSMKKILVTGGTGFIGSALVKRLLRDGHKVRVLDDNSRGATRRLLAEMQDFELVLGDIRDPEVVNSALRGVDVLHHLAYVNGTENFYKVPERVLEIAVKGMINVLDGAIKNEVGEIFLASSSEVYQRPMRIPTDEAVQLVVPDVMNPRFSYGGGKIICELLAVNYGRKFFDRICIYRPHNVYGPDMGWEHVIPQFVKRLHDLSNSQPNGLLQFSIQGDGGETRSFCFIDDFIDGVALLQAKGEHLNVYHIGTLEEVPMKILAHLVAETIERKINIVPGKLLQGSVARRCPDIGKIEALGYNPKIILREGVAITAGWYMKNISMMPAQSN